MSIEMTSAKNKVLVRLKEKLEENGQSREYIAGELFAARAAMFLLVGPDGAEDGSAEDLDYERVMALSKDLKSAGILCYAKANYEEIMNEKPEVEESSVYHDDSVLDTSNLIVLGEDPHQTERFIFKDSVQDQMKYEGYLLAGIGKMTVLAKYDIDAKKREKQLMSVLDDRSLTYREYWDFKALDRGTMDGIPYANEDRSVYEYEASENDWRLLASAMHTIKGDGGKTMELQETERIKNLPLMKLAMKNKQLGEKLRRGDLTAVTEAVQKTHQSFTFKSEEELKQQQERAKELNDKMHKIALTSKIGNVTNHASNNQEWRDLTEAVQKFSEAKGPEEAKKRSAAVLIAVEKYTKGRKSEKQNADTKACVDAALSAVSICVPDARNNPSVRPLVDRFNEVRRHRFQNGIEIEDYGTSSLDSAPKAQQKVHQAKMLQESGTLNINKVPQ